MTPKYLIFGATGNIGSNLADQLYKSNQEVHLVGRNKEEIKSLSEKFKCTYSVADVLDRLSYLSAEDRWSLLMEHLEDIATEIDMDDILMVPKFEEEQ